MTVKVLLPEKLTICDHPIVKHNLALLRDVQTRPELFRNCTKRIAEFLFIKASEDIPTKQKVIQTPMMPANVETIPESIEIIVAPILRAGLVFSEAACEVLPSARIHHIGLFRDEETLKPVTYYNNMPDQVDKAEDTYAYILDPMLATGGSAIAALKVFENLEIPEHNIKFISLISAPEGINKVHTKYPNVKIITACVDERLNPDGYIIPGLGDAGDRAFNTEY